MEKRKICFAASSGGHLEQLLKLEPLMQKYDSVLVTEKTPYNLNIKNVKVKYLHHINRREIGFLPYLVMNTLSSIRILIEEKPDAIVTTGVLAIIPLCLIGKITGKKIIFIESFAKVTSPTMTGKFLYRFADRFYVQWEPMLKYYPKAIYMGSLY